MITCLDVNTCEKCKALKGEVFRTEDVPVLPIHPRCHCVYCAPAGGDEGNEPTASGADLEELYARKGVKGYRDEAAKAAPKAWGPKGVTAAKAAPVIPAGALQAKVEAAMKETAPALAEGVRKQAGDSAGKAAESTAVAEGVRKAPEMHALAEKVPGQTGKMPMGATLESVVVSVGHSRLVDAQSEYFENATPNKGQFTYDIGFDAAKNLHEIEDAMILYNSFGGDIRLRVRSEEPGVMTPDYSWRGKSWDQKTCTTEKSADSAIRHGMKQIADAPGGLVLDYEDRVINMAQLAKITAGRIRRGPYDSLDVIVIRNNNIGAVWRFLRNKEKESDASPRQ